MLNWKSHMLIIGDSYLLALGLLLGHKLLYALFWSSKMMMPIPLVDALKYYPMTFQLFRLLSYFTRSQTSKTSEAN